MSTFALKLITREGAQPDRRVTSVDVPAAHGRLTVLARHEPLVCAVLPGAVKVVDEAGTHETWQTPGGVLEVGPEETTLLVGTAAQQ